MLPYPLGGSVLVEQCLSAWLNWAYLCGATSSAAIEIFAYELCDQLGGLFHDDLVRRCSG